MQKVYERINWENDPSTNTAINEDNLNKMDYAINEIDTRVVRFSKQYDSMVEATKNANTATSNANSAISKANTATANANSATESAQSAAEEANNAVDALKGALEGTVINDETPSEVTTYSSKRIELFDIQESTDRTLYNTKHGGYRLLEMLCNTIQNGTPTVDSPVAMMSTGECVEIMQGAYSTSNGAYLGGADYKSTFICNKNPIPCKKGDVFTIELDKEYTVHFLGYANGSFSGNVSSQSSKTHTYTVPNNTITHLNFNVSIIDTYESIDDVGKITLTINGKYVNCVKTHGKNFLNGVPNTVSNQGVQVTPTLNKQNTLESFKIIGTAEADFAIALFTNVSIKSGTYKLSIECEGAETYKRLWIKTDGYTSNTLSVTQNKGEITIDIPTDLTNAILYFWGSSGSTYNITLKAMLRKADITDDTYEPYKESIAYYYTDELLRKGDIVFKDSDGLWKVEHNVAEVVFDGNEKWLTSGDVDAQTFFYYLEINNKTKSNTNAFCSHFVEAIIYLSNTTLGFSVSSSEKQLRFRMDGITSLDDWIAFLQANDVRVQYELATPTIEVLDTDSQIALNSLETFNTVTYIEVDSRVQPLGIKGQYGTSDVGALALENANLHDNADLTYLKHGVANNLSTTEEGFVLDARQGTALQRQITLQNTGFTASLATKAIKVLTYNLTEVEILPYEEGWAGVGAVVGYTDYSIIGVLKIEVNDGLSIVRYNGTGVTLYNHTGTSITVTGTITLLYANNGLIN